MTPIPTVIIVRDVEGPVGSVFLEVEFAAFRFLCSAGTQSRVREFSAHFDGQLGGSMLTWLQFGDLHASDADGWGSLDIFSRLIDEANRHLVDTVDFAVLPGDNANHAEPEQFQKIADAASRLKLPLHILPGDHDFESGSLQDFYRILGAKPLPHAADVDGHRCIFLDLVSAGSGGPDFRLGADQMRWLRRQMQEAKSADRPPIVFMHAYPNDLKADADEIEDLFSRAQVAFVGTGHTHYNELVNQGGVIYAATRSTGEVEEGHPGFSIGVVDGSVVSWHFKPVDAAWPLVLITSPADHRMITNPSESDQIPSGRAEVRAKIFGGSVKRAAARIDDGAPVAMNRSERGVWTATLDGVADGLHDLSVEATTADNAVHRDGIRVQFGNSGGAAGERRPHFEPVGEWPERHLAGTQLGPNKNGRKW